MIDAGLLVVDGTCFAVTRVCVWLRLIGWCAVQKGSSPWQAHLSLRNLFCTFSCLLSLMVRPSKPHVCVSSMTDYSMSYFSHSHRYQRISGQPLHVRSRIPDPCWIIAALLSVWAHSRATSNRPAHIHIHLLACVCLGYFSWLNEIPRSFAVRVLLWHIPNRYRAAAKILLYELETDPVETKGNIRPYTSICGLSRNWYC